MRYGKEVIRLRGRYVITETEEKVVIINRLAKGEYRMLVIPLNSDTECKLFNPNKTLERIAQKLNQIPLKGIAPITVYF